MPFISWHVRSSNIHNCLSVFLSWIPHNASTVKNITIRNITETGFCLATFWITLSGCAKQIQIAVEGNKRKQSGFFYQPNQSILSSGESVAPMHTHTHFFQLNYLSYNKMRIPLPEKTQEKQNLKRNRTWTGFTFLTFENILNISNL